MASRSHHSAFDTEHRTHGPEILAVHDLRRARSRDAVETLIERSAYLATEDRRLIELVYGEGLTTSAVARLGFGPVRGVRRRVHRLVRRMLDPVFLFVAARSGEWPATRRAVATQHFLQGRTMGDVARRLGITYYAVRRHHDAVRALAEADLETPARRSSGARVCA